MSSDDPQDDAPAGLPPKRKELKLEPINKDVGAAAVGIPDDLAEITRRVNELAQSASEHLAHQEGLTLPKKQDGQPAAQLTEASQPAKQEPAAAQLIRSKLEKLYATEPDPNEEAVEAYQAGAERSKHQQYMLNLTNSGKSLAEIQSAWHAYYTGLPDKEKHEVWQEFYSAHAAPQAHAGKPHMVHFDAAAQAHANRQAAGHTLPFSNDIRTVAEIKNGILRRVRPRGVKLQARHHLKSLAFGLGMGGLVVLILLFGFFNERFIAPFMSPSSQVSATPIVGSSSDVGPDPKILIPKINVEVPVIYGTDSNNEQSIEDSLEEGVVHYSTSALPGQTGNVVIVGHSSNNILNKGKYKFAFVLLKRLEIGDTFHINKDGVRYTYQIYEKKVVKPTDVSVLGPAAKPNSATLITCDPPGTSLNRLIIIGEQISPDPSANKTVENPQTPPLTSAGILPGNSPSLWQRFTSWFH